jgi:hypothetical protein
MKTIHWLYDKTSKNFLREIPYGFITLKFCPAYIKLALKNSSTAGLLTEDNSKIIASKVGLSVKHRKKFTTIHRNEN